MRSINDDNTCLSAAFDIVLQLPFGTTPNFHKPRAKARKESKADRFWRYIRRWLARRGMTYVIVRVGKHPVDAWKDLKYTSKRAPLILIGRSEAGKHQHAVVLYNGRLYDSRWRASGIPKAAFEGGTMVMMLVPRPRGKYMYFRGMYRVKKMKRMRG